MPAVVAERAAVFEALEMARASRDRLMTELTQSG
jgi:hypothetical protein